MKLNEWIQSSEDLFEIYELTTINKGLYNKIKGIEREYSLLVITSSECQYCHIYIPHLWKIYENLDIKINLIIWENFTEDEIYDLIDKYDLTGLPTIIFLDNQNMEFGRFVKEPSREILELDILHIL
ncbi:MAG: TlpA family protein disulfide reductase [Candidatus Hodarchaeales archaeon]|jgi:thiol-disulfide isomerase/thioredoxin